MPLTTRTTRRPLAAGALAALVAGTLGAALAAPASAASPGAPGTSASPAAGLAIAGRASAAATWVGHQLVDGDHLVVSFGGTDYPDQGLTADAVLAFAASGTNAAPAARAWGWLSTPDNVAAYTGDGTTEAYAGATAKLALTAEVRHVDPTAVGGRDLVAQLRGLLAPSGRFTDRSQYGDFSNSFGQSYALLALARTAKGAPGSAVSFLAGARCADGGYPSSFGATTCTSDPDATALAVQALAATGRSTAAAAGMRWLVAHQGADGGFAAAGGPENANTTGLAAQALAGAGRGGAANKARAWLRTVQVTCSGPADERGALAYDATGFDAGTATRATVQGILGLAGVPFGHLDAASQRAAEPTFACAS
ncbi:hypothetical protein [Lapillicoccus jejuensis]|uniref:Prenyltransferase/squalene oxidase-like repeat protein n=1 Tax=Lapillicoccus jejuensis TaxID=402171 RepID=A0A542DY63_9MICO|nr:hypothetical protein [Lapillicoccus jejuensis]TQJ08042.1 hypothetical protein FB458_1121 [Lapillicoccus jejuensis]